MLSDTQIMKALSDERLAIAPFETKRLQPASYDVCLGDELLVLCPGGPLDPRVDTTTQWVRQIIPTSGFMLLSGDFVLGTTAEAFVLGPDVVGQVEGKSSLGRLGLEVHATAGFIDPGFYGQVTLELSCVHRRGVLLYPGMPIGQIAFETVRGVQRPYQGKYVHQVGPTASRYHENWDGQVWK